MSEEGGRMLRYSPFPSSLVVPSFPYFFIIVLSLSLSFSFNKITSPFTADFERVIQFFLQRGESLKAVEVLQRQPHADLFYKCV